MMVAEKEKALNRGCSLRSKIRDENCGTSAAERASRGVARGVSGYGMPSLISALVGGHDCCHMVPLNCLYFSQQLQTARPLDHARRLQQWDCSLLRLCGRGFAPEAIFSGYLYGKFEVRTRVKGEDSIGSRCYP